MCVISHNTENEDYLMLLHLRKFSKSWLNNTAISHSLSVEREKSSGPMSALQPWLDQSKFDSA